MTDITIYHNPRCSKSRRTKAILDEKGLDYTVVEYLDEPPSEKQLADILGMLGKEPLELIRSGETLFQELGLSEKEERSDAEWIRIMVENPRLIERPIVINGSRAVLGRPPEAVLRIL